MKRPETKINLLFIGEYHTFVPKTDKKFSNSAKFQAILDKSRFGSGSKGMCIHYLNEWMTPRMFEVKCGLEKSRDWRRTIHYQGDTLKTLIQYNILKPHAQVS